MAEWEAPFDPFEALGIERDATSRTIKHRYHELARRYHPNRHQGSDTSKAALSEHFHDVYQAWQLLAKTERRQRYVELLQLHDLHQVVVAGVANILNAKEQDNQNIDQQRPATDGHVSSDADDDDELPRIAGITRRATLDHSAKTSSSIGNATDASLKERNSQAERQGRSPVSRLRGSGGSRPGSDRGSGNDDEGSDANATTERRKQLEKLRMKEFDAFNKYKDAMFDKFAAEESADKSKERYERAKWRREYHERAPRHTSQRVRLLNLVNKATKAFSIHQPIRKRNRSTVSYGSQILSTGDPISPITPDTRQYLTLPTNPKSAQRRGYSSDISADQESTEEDENSSDKATSPSRSPRPASPQPGYSRHKRWESVPNPRPVLSTHLPNGNHDLISPITGPGPKVFVRQPTNLADLFSVQHSDVESASVSGSSRSPSPQPFAEEDRGRFQLVPHDSVSDMFGVDQDRRSRSPSAERRAGGHRRVASLTRGQAADVCHFKIKRVGKLQYRNIPKEHVHMLTSGEKQWMLGVEPDADMDPVTLLENLSKLDIDVASKFTVKRDIKDSFNFRLIYGHREVVKQRQHSTFIALSYRRKLQVEKEHDHFTLPLEPEMFQAVWDERLSDNEGVWIDQVCIDASREGETFISMSAMDMVYRSARLVVVALDDVDLAAHEGTILEGHMEEYERQAHVPANKRFRRKPTPYLESHEDLGMVIQKIMKSTWFNRAWCRHEMRLAREHVFLVPCRNPGSWSGRNVLRFTGKCLTHLLGLATEIPFEEEVEAVKPALYNFFRDRSKLPAHAHDDDHRMRMHHGNFTTVVAEVFMMEAGGDPKIPVAQRQADARKDKISIILNTMECGLALQPGVRDPHISLPTPECNYMLLLLALAARDPGALASVGHPLRQLPFEVASSWMFEPTNVDSGLNKYRTLNRLPDRHRTATHCKDGEHFVQLGLKFLHPGHVKSGRPTDSFDSADTVELARHFVNVCEKLRYGRNRTRYLINDKTANRLFGSMHDVYVETLACVLECGLDWMSDVCQRYGMGRWKNDLKPAYALLVALKNTCGRWPESAWTSQAAGFVMDFVNFLIIRGMPQRQLTQPEDWKPVCVTTPDGGRVLTFVPSGDNRVAVPAALLDPDYIHLARLWVLQPRGEYVEDRLPHYTEWTMLGKSVLFSDSNAIDRLESNNGMIREGMKVFGRAVPRTPKIRVPSPPPR